MLKRKYTVAATLVSVATVASFAADDSPPADALSPANPTAAAERIAQLEERILLLERRLAQLEAAPAVVPAVRYVQGGNAPQLVPVMPVPEPAQEVNGVKFKVFLLGADRANEK